jgi:hypothetical protein
VTLIGHLVYFGLAELILFLSLYQLSIVEAGTLKPYDFIALSVLSKQLSPDIVRVLYPSFTALPITLIAALFRK